MQDISADCMPLFFRILEGHEKKDSFAYYLEYLALHMPEARLKPALDWIIRNGLTGQRFLDFIYNDCKRSGLELVRQLTMRIEGEKKARALLTKDMRL